MRMQAFYNHLEAQSTIRNLHLIRGKMGEKFQASKFSNFFLAKHPVKQRK